MAGDVAAVKKMEEYNLNDVDPLLEKAYLDLRGWMHNHPKSNSGAFCEVCDSNKIQWRGPIRSKTRTGRKFQCKDCGSWGQRWDAKD